MASKSAGGNFTNGAITAAFVHLFNAEAEYFKRGKLAHKVLQEYLRKRDPMQWKDEVPVNSSLNESGKGRLDLLHVASNGGFEIKPNNYEGVTSGIVQIDDYVASNQGLNYGAEGLVFVGIDRITLYGNSGLNQYEFTYFETGYHPGLVVYEHTFKRNWGVEAASAILPFLRGSKIPRGGGTPSPVPEY